MADGHDWQVSRTHSEDLGFALTCLVSGAIALDEFKNWIYLVLAESEEFPDYLIDLSDVGDKFELVGRWRDLIGFWPASPLSRAEKKAVVGIAYARFPHFRHDTISRAAARTALQQSTGLRPRFARSFPTIDFPDDSRTESAAGHDRRVSRWWLSGSDQRPISVSEVQNLFSNQMAARQLTMRLESDTGLTLELVTNRTRVRVALSGPDDVAGHAIDPDAAGTSSRYLLQDGREADYPDRDSVAVPDALILIGYILAHGTPPPDRWSVDFPG